MSFVSKLAPKNPRTVRLVVQTGILAVILLSLGAVGFIEYSAQPVFCTNCHNMLPYYESWETSSHSDVPCIRCHYAPGIKAEAMGKLQAANQVVKYVTGAYGTKPWAEIEDAACLRSGCHSERKLEGEVDFNGIRFDHTSHLRELRRGKQLRCTSCHSQIVQGEHVAVTGSTCFLCHFKDQPRGQPVGGCTGCHVNPPRVLSSSNVVVDHPQYVRDLVSCVSCHEQVVSGDGGADQSRCYGCHNEPERLAEYENTTLVHRVHLAEHNIECAQCHLPIAHRMVALRETFDLDCVSCHQGTHEAQRRLYSGMGGHGTDDAPSAMYLARVSCGSCHGLPRDVAGHAQVQMAGEATCMSCHGVSYANILPSWQREMEQRLVRVRSIVEAAARAPRTGDAGIRSRGDSLLALARENVDLVAVGRGAHNIVYADELLRAAVRLVERAADEGGLVYAMPALDLGPAVGEDVCLRCHLGIEGQGREYLGGPFSHGPHVESAELPCSTCHTPLDEHGGMRFEGRSGCADCHHGIGDIVPCTACHQGGTGVPSGPIERPEGTFLHSRHLGAGLQCSVCHAGARNSAADVQCMTCHESHHRPEASCSSCHSKDVKEIHPAEAHGNCLACHGDRIAWLDEWTRETCQVCHKDRVDHYAPNVCTGCHTMPGPPGGSAGGV
jgi:nitrate/TMAO reductase-like tetraheme cytochrome c subunit